MGVQRVLLDGQRTWTVTGEDHLPVGPVEEYLEFLRVAQRSSPNTIRSHSRTIYRKLGVNSRAEAVARADALRLVEGSESPR